MATFALCFLLIIGSAILSSSEIALFSLSRVQIKRLKDQSEIVFRRIKALLQDSIGLLITILLFNELINISLGSLLTSALIDPLPFDWKVKTFFGVLISTPIVLLFCELTPKVLASKMNQLIISLFLPLIFFLYQLTRPLVSIIRMLIPVQPKAELKQFKEEDFLILAEEKTEAGQLHETELELIKNVFEMDDINVETLATPIKKLQSFSQSLTLEAAAQTIFKNKKYFSRIPIYGSQKDEIVGVINAKDLVSIALNPEAKKMKLMDIAKEPLFVSAEVKLDQLFRKMKSKKVQVAFLQNQQGKTTSMITIQDVLDAIVEEAFEE